MSTVNKLLYYFIYIAVQLVGKGHAMLIHSIKYDIFYSAVKWAAIQSMHWENLLLDPLPSLSIPNTHWYFCNMAKEPSNSTSFNIPEWRPNLKVITITFLPCNKIHRDDVPNLCDCTSERSAISHGRISIKNFQFNFSMEFSMMVAAFKLFQECLWSSTIHCTTL